MKKLLVALGMLLAATSISFASDYEAQNINEVTPTVIKYHDVDLCYWWNTIRFGNGQMGMVCSSTIRAQLVDALSAHQELEALKKRTIELEKRVTELEKPPVEDK